MLLLGISGMLLFVWVLALFFVPLLRERANRVAVSGPAPAATPTPEFVLPPTWTPGPTEVVIPTSIGTQVYSGLAPTRIYTPRPTSLPGVPKIEIKLRNKEAELELARIMQGESAGDWEAAYMVGWVAKNRLLHAGYGESYSEVARGGFFGYLEGIQPREEFLKIARQILRAKEDPTGGSLYALSRTDITNLGIPPGRADVAFGEWFFFRTWPLDGL